MIDQLVIIENDRPMTTSLIVAERFGKDHPDVMKAVKAIKEQRSRKNHRDVGDSSDEIVE